MRLLLDTHILLWFMNGDVRLSDEARARMTAAKEIFVSSACMWEIAIKARIGKVKADPEEIVQAMEVNGMLELPVYMRHAIVSGKLPMHHRDPFDRLLVAQAVSEQMRLLTSDSQLCPYSELVEYV